MPSAFVHGNPEAPALWRTLVSALKDRGATDLHLLAPPGFGAPVPDGWQSSQTEYRDWLIGELESLGGNVDLVGHDWGAGHVFGVLAERPDLIRSWSADCAGLIHRDYVWHDMAQVWQTPEAGEQAVAAMIAGDAETRAAAMISLGLPEDIATEIAEAQTEEMGQCILGLYRSAAQPAMVELGMRLSSTEPRPGLVIVATADSYCGPPAFASEVAALVSAKTVTLEGLGHWWMFDGASQVADALIAHWSEATTGI